MKIATITIAALLQAGAATGQVYKCQAADGTLAYSDAPCPGGKASVIDLKPNTVDTSAIRNAQAPTSAPSPDPAPRKRGAKMEATVKSIEQSNAAMRAARERSARRQVEAMQGR